MSDGFGAVKGDAIVAYAVYADMDDRSVLLCPQCHEDWWVGDRRAKNRFPGWPLAWRDVGQSQTCARCRAPIVEHPKPVEGRPLSGRGEMRLYLVIALWFALVGFSVWYTLR